MDDGEYALLCMALAGAFVEEIPEYLRARDSDISVEQIDAVVLAAHGAFEEWRALRAREQRETPLELLRSAMRLVLGEDQLPATSRELSEPVWRLHVQWGIARAELIAGVIPGDDPGDPTGLAVAIVSTNLMDRTRIEEGVESRGARTVVWRNPGAVAEGLQSVRPAVAFVDLEHGAARDLIQILVDTGIRTIVYGPHVDDHAQAAALAQGAAEALNRSVFFRRLETLIPTVI